MIQEEHRYKIKWNRLFIESSYSPFFKVTFNSSGQFIWRIFTEEGVSCGDDFLRVIGKIIRDTREKMMYIAHFTFAVQHLSTTTNNKLKKH